MLIVAMECFVPTCLLHVSCHSCDCLTVTPQNIHTQWIRAVSVSSYCIPTEISVPISALCVAFDHLGCHKPITGNRTHTSMSSVIKLSHMCMQREPRSAHSAYVTTVTSQAEISNGSAASTQRRQCLIAASGI
jgi:hypothetical protein